MQSSKKIILIVAIICLIGAALGLGYFSFRKKNTSLAAKPASSAPANVPPEPAEVPVEQKTAWQTYKPAESASNNAPPEPTEAPVEQKATGQSYKPEESLSNNALPDENAEQSAPKERQIDPPLAAAQADDQKNISELAQSLQGDANPGTLEVIMRLGHDKILPLDAAAKAAYGWAKAHRASFNQEECAAFLRDHERSPVQRAIAAAALAAASNQAAALAVLQKYAEEETDQNVRRIYDEAITRLRKAE